MLWRARVVTVVVHVPMARNRFLQFACISLPSNSRQTSVVNVGLGVDGTGVPDALTDDTMKTNKENATLRMLNNSLAGKRNGVPCLRGIVESFSRASAKRLQASTALAASTSLTQLLAAAAATRVSSPCGPPRQRRSAVLRVSRRESLAKVRGTSREDARSQ